MTVSDFKTYIRFSNHHEGLRLSSVLREHGIKHTISPTPRSFGCSCGISIIINKADMDLINGLISKLGITIDGVEKVPINKDWQYSKNRVMRGSV